MGDQRPLFPDIAPEPAAPSRSGLIIALVLEALRAQRAPVTASELASDAGMVRSDLVRTLPAMSRLGLAAQDNQRQCRVSGRLAVTWRAK